jgi:hypothetical protein
MERKLLGLENLVVIGELEKVSFCGMAEAKIRTVLRKNGKKRIGYWTLNRNNFSMFCFQSEQRIGARDRRRYGVKNFFWMIKIQCLCLMRIIGY